MSPLHRLSAIGLLLTACSEQAQDKSSKAKRVIVIGVDGMSPDGIKNSPTPILDSVVQQGASTMTARGVLPAATTGLEEIYPTIFGILRQQRPNATIGAIYDWKDFGRLVEQSALDYNSYKVTGKEKLDEDETVQLAISYIKDEKPDFLFIHMDHAGHQHEHGSPEYNESVTKADTLIGTIL